MRILLVHPGASWSTADLWSGITKVLTTQGHEVVHYALDGRIQAAGGWLTWSWKHAGKEDAKPSEGDIVYLASIGLLERALRHQVDWVLVISSMWLHPEALLLARRAGIKVAILFTESPNDDAWQMNVARLANACWVNERTSVEPFRKVCPHTYYWQHALDPERHHVDTSALEEHVPAHDVVFVGTGWIERCELLSAVDWDGIDFGLYGSWSLLGSRSKLRKHLRGGITPNELTAALYRKAKIGLNLHRTSVGFGREVPHITHAESLNPRCYELAACGLFYLTDYRAELAEVFGDTVPTFTTAEELEQQIRYYLANDEARQTVASRLPEMVAPHTFESRVRQLCIVLENYRGA